MILLKARYFRRRRCTHIGKSSAYLHYICIQSSELRGAPGISVAVHACLHSIGGLSMHNDCVGAYTLPSCTGLGNQKITPQSHILETSPIIYMALGRECHHIHLCHEENQQIANTL